MPPGLPWCACCLRWSVGCGCFLQSLCCCFAQLSWHFLERSPGQHSIAQHSTARGQAAPALQSWVMNTRQVILRHSRRQSATRRLRACCSRCAGLFTRNRGSRRRRCGVDAWLALTCVPTRSRGITSCYRLTNDFLLCRQPKERSKAMRYVKGDDRKVSCGCRGMLLLLRTSLPTPPPCRSVPSSVGF